MLKYSKSLLIAAAVFLLLTSAALLWLPSPLRLFSHPVVPTSPTLSDFCTRMQRDTEVIASEVIDSVHIASPATPQGDPSSSSIVAEIQLFTPGAIPVLATWTIRSQN